ncbi:MAG: XdhC family protein [Chloroflexota bacterium]|jgi:xanthine dehydrogenase accessory factor
MTIFEEITQAIANGRAIAVCTIIETSGSTPRHEGSKLLVYEDGKISGSVGGGEVENRVITEALGAIQDGKTRLLSYSMVDPQQGDPGVCGGTLEVYVEPILPKPVLVIIGAGHVGKALAHLAKWLGFVVVLSDDRVEFCNPEANPDGDFFYPVKMDELPKHVNFTPHTYVVLTTRGSNVDIEGLEPLLRVNTAYIGVIGSKRRWLTTRKALQAKGVAEDALNRVYSPMGLELNAETPEEIAVSIMAEILMLRNGGSGKQMRM